VGQVVLAEVAGAGVAVLLLVVELLILAIIFTPRVHRAWRILAGGEGQRRITFGVYVLVRVGFAVEPDIEGVD